eukprot:CAMPEP_0194764982 /NCGR_PEP_ID=MMETSP0323_2-20130528/24269_1 /TAXON_ID=2866 ORGANISM="Crypthecodinium cohnii, Strain Seligo" /NCGR_SAMPLE_ID=MMETSP0323_2 /ASSEMBLY_ACC=CAM_ASM_000346 /LENGTH=243 /DNA_ID=CAMNT_0039693351 /DNA_START=76 /DNA_END=807 /DNA_ORIENTATION=+
MARDILEPVKETSDTSSDDSILQKQQEFALELQQERPVIEGALKNYISCLEANSFTGSGPSSSSKTLLTCAKITLKAMNSLDLPSSVEWGHKYPQETDESGSDYMERLARYKVVQNLWQQCRRSEGTRVAKCLGKTTLKIAMGEVEKAVHDYFESNTSDVSSEQLGQFLDGFMETVDNCAEGSDGELVWSVRWQDCLAKRQAARKVEAQERSDRAASAEDYADQLRSALTSTTAVVEELPSDA